MNATSSSVELDALARRQSNVDSEAVMEDPVQSIRTGTCDSLLQSGKSDASHQPITHDVPGASDRSYQRRGSLWRSVMHHCTACCLVFGAIFALITVPTTSLSLSYSNYLTPTFGFCESDGTFNSGLESVSAWTPSKAFQITVAFGPVSFSTAKFIDVVWDVVGD